MPLDIRFRTGLTAAAFLWCGGALAAQPTPFLPHQAAYDLSLKSARGQSSVAEAQGRMLYQFAGNSCEGYTTDFRQVMRIEAGEDKSSTSDLRSTSWEDGEGKSYRFKIETRLNDNPPVAIDGVAERTGGKVTIKLKKPSAKTFTVDGAALFPTEHIARIIDAARSGKSLLEVPVYDGSDTGEKVYSTLTVIGQPIAADRETQGKDAASGNDLLAGQKRWPVTVSYFDRDAKQDGGEQTPSYAMAFELFENGVSRALSLDYNDFVVAGALSKFEAKAAKGCK